MPGFTLFRRPADIVFRRLLLPLLPTRLKLPALAHWWRITGAVEPEILEVPLLMPVEQRAVALDVGANNGVTACHLARHFSMVYAFEANPLLAAQLEREKPRKVVVRNEAVSAETEGSLLLRVPVVRGQALSGWASVESPGIPEATEFLEYQVQTVSIDSLHFEKISLIKIDVEGHEMAVLQGAKETLRRHSPWLIVEVWDSSRPAVRQFLEDLGYHCFTLKELNGHAGSPQNLIFLPPKDAARFIGKCD